MKYNKSICSGESLASPVAKKRDKMEIAINKMAEQAAPWLGNFSIPSESHRQITGRHGGTLMRLTNANEASVEAAS